MIIGINGLGTRGGGVEIVLRSLLDGFRESRLAHKEVEQIVLFMMPEVTYPFAYPTTERMKFVFCDKTTDHALTRFAWLQYRFDRLVRQHKCDVVINLAGMAGKLSVPQILMIQNALYFSSEGQRTYRHRNVPLRYQIRNFLEVPLARWFFGASSRLSQRVVVQSEVMRERVCADFPHTKDNIFVVRPSVPSVPSSTIENQPALSQLSKCRGKRFLYVGNDHPYKNIQVIIDAARESWSEGLDWHFFLTLNRFWKSTSPNIHFLGPLGRSELATAIRHSNALIMPSLVETVGLPMLEAMKMGTPVLAADRPYAREMCGDFADYFNPFQSQELRNVLRKVSMLGEKHAYRNRERGKVLDSFPTPSCIVDQWIEHCQEILQDGRPQRTNSGMNRQDRAA